MKRKANYELLRILAMLMIIGLHYLDKGGILPKLNTTLSIPGALAWLVEAFFIMAVNVYVLLSGYFGSGGFRLRKVAKLWGQVAFYSIGIAALCFVLGILPVQQLSIYRLFGYVFPVVTNHYWFATTYVLLLFLMPFLNAGVERLSERELRWGILGLLLFTCFAKTLIPMQLPTDQKGYDIIWFVILYLVGAYLCKYGREAWKRYGWLLFFGSGLLIFLVTMVMHRIWVETGALEAFQNYAYSYNHLFCLTGAVGLFMAFDNIRIKSERWSRLICEISGCTFGVYLIHEHMDLRYLWPQWFQTPSMVDRFLFVPHMMVTILVVFSCCALIEYLRKRLFAFVGKKLSGNKTV